MYPVLHCGPRYHHLEDLVPRAPVLVIEGSNKAALRTMEIGRGRSRRARVKCR